MKVLVTGAAGFIGFHVCQRLALSNQCEVLGVDNLNDYASLELKRARLVELEKLAGFRFVRADFADASAFAGLHGQFGPDYVVHLGAQTGVRYSLENPAAYVHSNLDGFASVLEAARRRPPKHLVFASSSSVYGANARVPFREDDDAGPPLSFYAATKMANEAMAYSYAHSFGLNLTGLRFFTVYGPRQRPDMAIHKFTALIDEGKPVPFYGDGSTERDYTYISDIIDGVTAAVDTDFGFEIINLGESRTTSLTELVRIIEECLGKKAKLKKLPMQAGDVLRTCADVSKARHLLGYKPSTKVRDGVSEFVKWYKDVVRCQ